MAVGPEALAGDEERRRKNWEDSLQRSSNDPKDRTNESYKNSAISWSIFLSAGDDVSPGFGTNKNFT